MALHADLSGGGRTTGLAHENGVRLAVEHANSRAGRAFDLALQVHDDGGSATRAQQVARRLAADGRVRAVIGPTTDACVTATRGLYQQASLPMVCVSVGLDDIAPLTYRVYASVRPTDRDLAAPLITYLLRDARARRTVLIDDAAEGDFSWEICADVDENVRSGQRTTVRHTLAATDDSAEAFRALAASVKDAEADAVVFGGGPARAAKLARALRSAGWSGARLATQRALDPRFLTAAGDAADGWVFATVFLDPTRVPAAKSFVTAYRARFGTSPPWYSAEAYDAALFVARAMTTLGPSGAQRGAIAGRLRETDYRGITKRLHYDASAYRYSRDGMYLFQVSDGRLRWLGQYENATA